MRRDEQIINEVVQALCAQDDAALVALRREAEALPAPVRARMRARWAALTNAMWRRWRDAGLDAAMRRWVEELA